MSLMVNTDFKEKPECPKTITLEKPHLNPGGVGKKGLSFKVSCHEHNGMEQCRILVKLRFKAQLCCLLAV